MVKVRIIARLDIKSENVIKGIRFDGLRVMGKPDDMAMRYYEQGADELLYIDTVASLYGRNNLTNVVRQAAAHIFIPLTVGGGIRSVEDAQKLLHNGADKIAINTAAVKDPGLITDLARALGSQAVVASLQVKRRSPGRWEVYIDNGREKTGIDALEWAKKVESLGAGEILITSVDRDGTGSGFEIDFIKAVIDSVSIPVIAGGGAKNPQHVVEVIDRTGADAVVVATMLHYNTFSIGQIKEALSMSSIETVNHG